MTSARDSRLEDKEFRLQAERQWGSVGSRGRCVVWGRGLGKGVVQGLRLVGHWPGARASENLLPDCFFGVLCTPKPSPGLPGPSNLICLVGEKQPSAVAVLERCPHRNKKYFEPETL